jgi:hypothetical protein
MMAVLSFSSCDAQFLDLTSGEITIKEINGKNSKEPYIVITHESKVYYGGNNIYDKEPQFNSENTSGNGNNCLDPGEKIKYDVECKNVGRTHAISVQARVTTNSPYAVIQPETYSLGFIESERTYYSGQNMAIFISLNANTPHGHKLRLDITFSDNSENVWNDYCIIVVR